MAEYDEVVGEVEIPKGVGTKGILKTIEDILKLPRVQNIEIDARGKVGYRYFLRKGETAKPLEIDFQSLQPMAVIRNGVVVELGDPDLNAAVAIGQLFNMAAVDHLFPVAVAVGADTQFWSWYESTTSIELSSREELYGVPVVRDRLIEDHVLILCAAYTRSSALVDTQKSYKLVIPQV